MYKIKSKYEKLPVIDQRVLRKQYCDEFNVEKAQFYNVIKSNSLTGEQLLFFAQKFDTTIENLFQELPKYEKRLSDKRKTKEETKEDLQEKIRSKIGIKKMFK